MTKPRRSRASGPLRAWAGESLWRQFVVWTIRSAVSLVVLGIGITIIMVFLVPNMIDGLTRILTR